MKIKQTLITLTVSIGAVAVFVTPAPTYAACGGVETSIINCEQKGQCEGGENPYEGTNPGDSGEKQAAYLQEYGHNYGKCMNDVEPSKEVKDTGVWGILLVVINILTAGVGILAVAGIVYGSVLYASAGGSAEQVKKAVTVFTNVIIGIVAYVGMYAFLNFIIPGGLFN